jgi:protein farnesyltransferase/geranylgeranyltransferase type-1 subunit alpha
MNDGSQELELTEAVLDGDAKNYHAWSHRHWAMRRFGLFADGGDLVDKLLEADVRNNSAWNHRFYVVAQTTGFTVGLFPVAHSAPLSALP